MQAFGARSTNHRCAHARTRDLQRRMHPSMGCGARRLTTSLYVPLHVGSWRLLRQMRDAFLCQVRHAWCLRCCPLCRTIVPGGSRRVGRVTGVNRRISSSSFSSNLHAISIPQPAGIERLIPLQVVHLTFDKKHIFVSCKRMRLCSTWVHPCTPLKNPPHKALV